MSITKLSIEEVEKWRNLAMSDSIVDGEAGFYARAMYFSKQLLDTMRENERLRSCLKAFYFDTMYKDSPGLHDIACELLAPYDKEFAEVQRSKQSLNLYPEKTVKNRPGVCKDCGERVTNIKRHNCTKT